MSAQHQTGPPSTEANDLGLQATLQLIAERARFSAAASGVAIAIGDRDGMVCRASTGTAPDVGACLRPDAGLSGYCLRSGDIVLCDDAQSDPRLDASAAQTLNLGSMVVMPVFAFGRLAGLLQVLSPRAHAFDPGQVMRLAQFAQLLRAALESRRNPPKFESAVEDLGFEEESCPPAPEIPDAAREWPSRPFSELEASRSELAAMPLAHPQPKSPDVEARVIAAPAEDQGRAVGSSPVTIETGSEATPVCAEAGAPGKSGFGLRRLLAAASVAAVLVVLVGVNWYVMRQRAGRSTLTKTPPAAGVAAVPGTVTTVSPKPAASLDVNGATAATTKTPAPDVTGKAGASRWPDTSPNVTLLKLANKMRQLTIDGIASLEHRAASGNPEAEVVLGLAYTQGTLLKKDPATAIAWYRKAAEQAYAPAEEALAIAYQLGSGVPKNVAESVRWYTRAAEHGSVMGANELGVMYSSGDIVRQNFAEALRWYRLAAQHGDATAEYNLARMYHLGQGVPANPALEFLWLRKAADQGFAAAQYNLALMYQEGAGVETDLAAAVRLLHKAANQEYALAQTHLGYVYLKGLGVPVDYAQSLRWYRTAAEKGESTAAYALSVRYFSGGNGVTQDYSEAAKWTKVAAEKGHPDAQYNLGVMYERGIGVAADVVEAADWYRRAADQAVGNAQLRLGLLYASGKGVTRDLVAAHKWLALSKGNVPESNEQLRSLEREMTRGQISDAQHAAEQWRATHQRR